MRKYEIIFIVRPDLPEEEVDKLIAQMEGVVTGAGGKLEKVEKMGRRRLAYRVKKYPEGFYVFFLLEASGDTVREFERRLKVIDTVIKFLTVRVDEELKRAEKRKLLRAKRDAKRPRSKAAAAATGAGPSGPPPSQPVPEAAQA